jgi:hypothetical protein
MYKREIERERERERERRQQRPEVQTTTYIEGKIVPEKH